MNQAATLLRIHLRRRIRDPLLHLSRAEAGKCRPDGRTELALRHAAGDLVVVLLRFLFTEIAAHHVVEDAAELIEKGHDCVVDLGFRRVIRRCWKMRPAGSIQILFLKVGAAQNIFFARLTTGSTYLLTSTSCACW